MSDETVPTLQVHPDTFRSVLRSSLVELEETLAARLGNSERLRRCRELAEFPAAREEWFAACDIYLSKRGLSALTRDTALLEDGKAYVLEMFRKCGLASKLLRNTTAVFASALAEGDSRFLQDAAAAMRAHKRKKNRDASAELYWCILTHWFAGLLWLMNMEQGFSALRQYLKAAAATDSIVVPTISHESYRKACERLKLKGYKAFAVDPPVLSYNPRSKSYRYDDQNWTQLEP
jgi:GNAT superfamily N-acetyltransferase